MTFELLKVCRPAHPALIELRVMYVWSNKLKVFMIQKITKQSALISL